MSATQLIRRQQERNMDEVVAHFAKSDYPLVEFETDFLKMMIRENGLTSVLLGVETMNSYRTALQERIQAPSTDDSRPMRRVTKQLKDTGLAFPQLPPS